MAMNKKEAAELDEAKKLLALAMALHWPIEPKPAPVDVRAVLDGQPYGTLFVGWWYNASGNSTWGDGFRVGQGCSSGHNHSTSSTTKTSTRTGGTFFHRKDEALLAARWELCEQFAKTLAKLDAEYIAALNPSEP